MQLGCSKIGIIATPFLSDISENEIVLMFGEDNQATVLELLGWLGPGPELVEAKEWRSVMRDELKQMLPSYRTHDTKTNPR